MSQERTEQPTGKRLRDARRKGQIVRSRDLALAGASVVATIALAQFGGGLLTGLGTRLAGDLSHFGDAPLRPIAAGDLSSLVVSCGVVVAVLVGPIALSTMLAGVVVHGLQGGWNFSTETLSLNWSRLNPANG